MSNPLDRIEEKAREILNQSYQFSQKIRFTELKPPDLSDIDDDLDDDSDLVLSALSLANLIDGHENPSAVDLELITFKIPGCPFCGSQVSIKGERVIYSYVPKPTPWEYTITCDTEF